MHKIIFLSKVKKHLTKTEKRCKNRDEQKEKYKQVREILGFSGVFFSLFNPLFTTFLS